MGQGAYAYASAKVRVLESYLLSDADYTRVIDAKDPETAFKAFNSLDYASELLDLEAKDYRVAMGRKMKRLSKVLEKIIPDPKLLRLLFLERDYFNIKMLFREKHAGENFDEHLDSASGVTKVDQLRRYIIDELDADIDPEIKIDIDELKSRLSENPDPEMIDNFVDRRLNRHNMALAKKIGSPFIITLYKLLADKNNLNIFFRARRLQKPLGWAEERFNDNGTIGIDHFRAQYETEDDTEFVNVLKNNLPSIFQTYADEYLSERQIARIELGMNVVIMDHLKKAKFIGMGPEVVAAYFFAKKYSIKNLSVIMALKFGGVEPAEIRKQLVQSYLLP